MARVETHKATKKAHKCTRCSEPITLGQEYYTWASGFRMPNIYQHKSHGYPRPSQTTGNEKLKSLFSAYEGFEDSVKDHLDGSSDVDREAVVSALESLEEDVRSVGDDYQESAENIEDGFGHSTSVSEEMQEHAEECQEAATEIEQVKDALQEAHEAIAKAAAESPEAEEAYDDAHKAMSDVSELGCPI